MSTHVAFYIVKKTGKISVCSHSLRPFLKYFTEKNSAPLEQLLPFHFGLWWPECFWVGPCYCKALACRVLCHSKTTKFLSPSLSLLLIKCDCHVSFLA